MDGTGGKTEYIWAHWSTKHQIKVQTFQLPSQQPLDCSYRILKIGKIQVWRAAQCQLRLVLVLDRAKPHRHTLSLCFPGKSRSAEGL